MAGDDKPDQKLEEGDESLRESPNSTSKHLPKTLASRPTFVNKVAKKLRSSDDSTNTLLRRSFMPPKKSPQNLELLISDGKLRPNPFPSSQPIVLGEPSKKPTVADALKEVGRVKVKAELPPTSTPEKRLDGFHRLDDVKICLLQFVQDFFLEEKKVSERDDKP